MTVRGALLRGLVVLPLLLAVSCGGGGETTADGKTVVTFWQFWSAETVQPLLEAFEAENPDLSVQMQQLTWQNGREKITAAVAAGNPPDLCELGSTWFAKFAANGALVDWTTPSVNLRPNFVMWDACVYEKRVLALPWLTGTRALFYNKALFREAGLDPETPPATWDELLAAMRAIHDPSQQRYGYGLNSGERYVQYKKFMPYAWGNGGRIVSEDGARCVFNADPVKQALAFYLQLKDVALLERQEILDQEFGRGRVGAMISGAWMLKKLPKEAPDLEFGVALVPRPAEGQGTHASFGGGELLVSFRKSKQQDAAFRLAEFLSRAENAMVIARDQLSVLPAHHEAAMDPFFTDDSHQAVFLEQLRTAVFPPNLETWVEIEDVVDSWLEKAVFGKAGVDEALAGACEEIQALLDR